MKQHQLMSLLSSRFTATIIYRVIYTPSDISELVELQIRQLPAGFSVHSITASKSGLAESLLMSDATLDAAKDLIKEESLCLEQSGFDWYREPQGYELVDLSLSTLSARPPVCMKGKSFFDVSHSEATEFVSQSLPGGIRLLLQHDCSGNVLIRPSLNAEAILLTGELETQALALFAFNGFRGALLDIVIHNHRLYVVDAIYFRDKWLDDLPLSHRLGFLIETMEKHGIDSSAVIRPVVVNPTDWLRIHNHGLTRGIFVRRKDSMPVYSRDTTYKQNYTQGKLTTYLLSQQSESRITLLKAISHKMLIRFDDDHIVESAGALPYYYNFHEQQMSLLVKNSTDPLMSM